MCLLSQHIYTIFYMICLPVHLDYLFKVSRHVTLHYHYYSAHSPLGLFSDRLHLVLYTLVTCLAQPRSQGFSLFVIGKSGKGPGTGRSHDFQHPDIVGVNKL
jgi:hypothetical protein